MSAARRTPVNRQSVVVTASPSAKATGRDWNETEFVNILASECAQLGQHRSATASPHVAFSRQRESRIVPRGQSMNSINRTGRGTSLRRPNRGLTLIEIAVAIGILLVIAAFLLPNVRSARPAARRSQCRNNLRQIVLALRNYEDVYHALPPAYTVDAHGKRLHSWRALILRYLDQPGIYKQIDFSKPWNDPVNAKAYARCPDVYHCPEDPSPPDHTTYLAVVTPKSCLRPATGRPLSEIRSPSSTAVIVEVDAAHAVHWMDPSDADEELVLSLNSKSTLLHSNLLLVALVDGSVQTLNADISSAARRELISAAESGKPAFAAEVPAVP